ncbi:MAG: hypothetical protein JOZ41_22200 [Chloroflexi bacterium]|nr:hypothetical protein [Chloroflexota bacterium]
MASPLTRCGNTFRSGLVDHLTDIAKLTSNQDRQADLRAWTRRVDFLAAQPGIGDIRVEVAASDVASVSRGRIRWNGSNMNAYGAAFDHAHQRHINIVLIAMPPWRSADMSDVQYRSMLSSYYDEIGSFSAVHHIVDIDINELGAHNAVTGQPITNITPRYLNAAVSLVLVASHAVRRHVPKAQIIVSESAAMTPEATMKLLAVFAALKDAGVTFIRGLNIYAGGPVEVAEIAPLIDTVRRDGDVWVTEFGVPSVGANGEATQALRVEQIFEAIIKAGVKRVIGYEEMDEPRLQHLTNLSPAEKNYGIIWRADGSMKPAAGVFLSIARRGSGDGCATSGRNDRARTTASRS